MIKVGILGAAGYTGGELIRLLLNHPETEIIFANSESNAGNLVSDVHEGLIGDTELKFTSEMPFENVDVVFFCFGHGKSEAFLKEHTISENVKIIDLAQDFRIKGDHDYVYGLPEINKEEIQGRCCRQCHYGVNRCRSETWCHYPLLMAQQQSEHLQALPAPAYRRNQAVADAGTGLPQCRYRLHPLSR